MLKDRCQAVVCNHDYTVHIKACQYMYMINSHWLLSVHYCPCIRTLLSMHTYTIVHAYVHYSPCMHMYSTIVHVYTMSMHTHICFARTPQGFTCILYIIIMIILYNFHACRLIIPCRGQLVCLLDRWITGEDQSLRSW